MTGRHARLWLLDKTAHVADTIGCALSRPWFALAGWATRKWWDGQ